MLLAHIPIVDALCRNADNDGEINPASPEIKSAELNATIKR